MEIHAFRLTPGQDLKKSLLSYAKGAKLEAACVVTCVGSLSKVSLRLANADGGKRGSNETVSLEERFEIVSLAGTVSRHGCHLHMSLSDYQGNVVGGHVLDGCVVFTTAEMVLGECVGHVFTRERDDETGFDELVVTTKLAVAPPPVTTATATSREADSAASDASFEDPLASILTPLRSYMVTMTSAPAVLTPTRPFRHDVNIKNKKILGKIP